VRPHSGCHRASQASCCKDWEDRFGFVRAPNCLECRAPKDELMSSRGGFRAWPTQRGPRWRARLAPNLGDESRQPLHFWQDERISSEHEPMRTVNYSLTKLSDPVIADDIVRQRLAVSPAPALCDMDPVVARRGPFSLRGYQGVPDFWTSPSTSIRIRTHGTLDVADRFQLTGSVRCRVRGCERSALRGRERAVPNAAARRRLNSTLQSDTRLRKPASSSSRRMAEGKVCD
jgi:hypothetical protein